MGLQTIPGTGIGGVGPQGEQGNPGNDGAQGPPGSDAPFGRTIILRSNRDPEAFPGGHTYIPMSHYETADDYVYFELAVAVSGTMTVDMLYSMSSSIEADVYLRADWSIVYDGSDPSDAPIQGAPFPLTTTDDQMVHVMPSSASASLSAGVFEGDNIHFRLTRLGTDEVNDVHTGDFRAISVSVSIV